MQTKQLLTRIWDRSEARLSELIEKAALRRDTYLDRVLAHEADMLLREVPKPNSPLAHRFLQRKMRELPAKKVNLTLSQSTVHRIDQACKDRNIPRDCFINRVILMLVAPSSFYERMLGFDPSVRIGEVLDSETREEFFGENWPTSLYGVAYVVNDDPFRGIRFLIDEHNRRPNCDVSVDPFLRVCIIPEFFNRNPADGVPPMEALYALNCWLRDSSIPGSRAAKKALDDLLSWGSPSPDPRPAQKGKKS
jgi:hypothetical protein